jgi:hypothetical protein
MSADISPAFGDAYKQLHLARKQAIDAGALTTAFLNAERTCRQTIHDAHQSGIIHPAIARAARTALDASIADTVLSVHRSMLAQTGVTPDAAFHEHKQALRAARTDANRNLQDALATHHPQPDKHDTTPQQSHPTPEQSHPTVDPYIQSLANAADPTQIDYTYSTWATGHGMPDDCDPDEITVDEFIASNYGANLPPLTDN